MATIAADSFNKADWALVNGSTLDTGSKWTGHVAGTVGTFYVYQKLVYCTAAGVIYANAAPGSAEYSVEADIKIVSQAGNNGIAGRIQSGADSYYYVYWNSTTGNWTLGKVVASTATSLGTYAATAVLGQAYRVRLEMKNATKKVFIDGVEIISSADNAVTGAGFGGMRAANSHAYNAGQQVGNLAIITNDGGGGPGRAISLGFMGGR